MRLYTHLQAVWYIAQNNYVFWVAWTYVATLMPVNSILNFTICYTFVDGVLIMFWQFHA